MGIYFISLEKSSKSKFRAMFCLETNDLILLNKRNFFNRQQDDGRNLEKSNKLQN